MKSDAAVRASASGGKWLLFSALGTLIALAGLGVIVARPSTASSLATLDVLEPSVEVRLAGQTEFSDADSGDAVAEGTLIRTDRTGLAAVSYEDGSLTRIGPVSTYELTTLATHKDRREIVGRLDAGQTFHRVTKASGSSSRFEVQTSNAVAAVRGTAFAVQCLTLHVCEVGVTEGIVAVRTPDGREIAVEAGHKVAVDRDGNLGDLELLLESDPWIQRNADIDKVQPGANADPGGDDAEPQRIELATEDDNADGDSSGASPRSSGASERQTSSQQTTPTSEPAATTTTIAPNTLDFSPQPQPHPDRMDGSEDTPPTTQAESTTTTTHEAEDTTTTTAHPRSSTTTGATTTTRPATTSTTRPQTTPQGTTSTTSEMEANDPPPTTTTSAPATTTSEATTTTSTTEATTTTSTTEATTTTSTTAPPDCEDDEYWDDEKDECRKLCPPTSPNAGRPPPCGNEGEGGGGSGSSETSGEPRWVSLSGSSWTSG